MLDLLAKHFHWLLFLLLEVVSVVLLFRYNSYQGSVWVTSANAVSGKVLEWQSDVEQFFHLENRAWQLAVRNVELQAQNARLRQQLADLQADTATIDSAMQQALSQHRLIQAKVVGSTLRRHDNLLTIDRGSSDGIRPDMGVVSGLGLVGVVYMVSSHYSVVMPLINVHSRISCAIRGSGYFGYLLWDGKSTTDVYMEDVPRHAHIEPGTCVETSGYSDIFPQGITVGRITGVGDSDDGLSYRLRISLATDFGCLREVTVIADDHYDERRRLLEAARDSLALTN